MPDFLIDFMLVFLIIGSDCSLHECLIREDIIGVATCELADCEDKVLSAVDAS